MTEGRQPSLSIIVAGTVDAAATFFRDAIGLDVTGGDGYAEVDAGAFTFSVMRGAMVSVGGPGGFILQFPADDVTAATKRAARHGAVVLDGPVKTDWGTESAFLRGPDGIVVEFFR